MDHIDTHCLHGFDCRRGWGRATRRRRHLLTERFFMFCRRIDQHIQHHRRGTKMSDAMIRQSFKHGLWLRGSQANMVPATAVTAQG